MRRLSTLKGEAERWRGLERRVSEVAELIDLAMAEEEPSLEDEIRSELNEIVAQFEEIEFNLVLSGEYEKRNAILGPRLGPDAAQDVS